MAQQFQEYKEKIQKALTEKDKPWTPIFDLIEAKTGVDRTYSFLGESLSRRKTYFFTTFCFDLCALFLDLLCGPRCNILKIDTQEFLSALPIFTPK